MTETTKKTASPVGKGELPAALKDKKQLAADDTFCFGCHKDLPCFTDCCADINILLTPYDVVSLARKIDIPTGEFLEKYTLTPITKELQLPVKMLKMGAEPERKCHFVGEQGCTVYDARPWSCRMYPLGMGLPPARAGETPEPVYFLFEDDYCKGHTESKKWQVAEWRSDQGVIEREEIEKGFHELVSHPWFIGGTRQLDPRQIEMFHMACYDIDTFRRFIFDSTFLDRFDLDETTVEQLRSDDTAVLRFAFRWLRFAMFGEPTMQTREDASQDRRQS